MVIVVRIIVVGIQIVICFLLQSSVFPHFELAGVVPDLLMVLVVATAYTRGIFPGMFTGLFAGLLVDFCFGDVIGIYGLLYMFIGYLNGYSNKIYDRDDYTIPMILIAVSEFVYCFLYYVVEFLLRGRLNLGFYMYRIMLPRVIYTVLIGVIFYKLFHMVHVGLSRLMQKEE